MQTAGVAITANQRLKLKNHAAYKHQEGAIPSARSTASKIRISYRTKYFRDQPKALQNLSN
jgi:hypothetical protein